MGAGEKREWEEGGGGGGKGERNNPRKIKEKKNVYSSHKMSTCFEK